MYIRITINNILEIKCPGITSPPNGLSTCPDLESKYGDKCSVSCNAGFILSGTGTVMCEEGTGAIGNWNETGQSCQRKFLL